MSKISEQNLHGEDVFRETASTNAQLEETVKKLEEEEAAKMREEKTLSNWGTELYSGNN